MYLGVSRVTVLRTRLVCSHLRRFLSRTGIIGCHGTSGYTLDYQKILSTSKACGDGKLKISGFTLQHSLKTNNTFHVYSSIIDQAVLYVGKWKM